MAWTRGGAAGVLTGMIALSGAADGANDVDIRLNVSESSPLDPGTDRGGDTVTVTVDLGGHAAPLNSANRPLLKVIGPGLGPWQFTGLTYQIPDQPSSGATSAVLDVVLEDFQAGDALELQIVDGSGASVGSPLGSEHAAHFCIDTGAAIFNLPKDGSLVSDCWVGGEQVLASGVDNGFYVVGEDGSTYSSNWGVTSAKLVRNGPACAAVELSGTMTDLDGNSLATFTMELWAYAGQQSLQGRVEMEPLGQADLKVEAAHLIVYGSSDPADALDENSKRRAVLTDEVYHKVVPNMGGGPGSLPHPQSIGVERLQSPAGFTAVTRWPDPDWPQIVEPSGTSWVSLQLWPRELALTPGGRSWSMDPPGRFVEFTLGVHSSVPADLETWAHRILCPLQASQAPSN